jgi:hypothetical protein
MALVGRSISGQTEELILFNDQLRRKVPLICHHATALTPRITFRDPD